MTYDTSRGLWVGNEAYLFLSASGGHPGNNSDAVRRWTAPATSSVQISGETHDLDGSCGGGVTVYVKKGSSVLWQKNISNGDLVGYSLNVSASVNSGESLDFGINRGPDSSLSCDSTYFDPIITLTPSGSSGSDTEVPSVQIKAPLNGGFVDLVR